MPRVETPRPRLCPRDDPSRHNGSRLDGNRAEKDHEAADGAERGQPFAEETRPGGRGEHALEREDKGRLRWMALAENLQRVGDRASRRSSMSASTSATRVARRRFRPATGIALSPPSCRSPSASVGTGSSSTAPNCGRNASLMAWLTGGGSGRPPSAHRSPRIVFQASGVRVATGPRRRLSGTLRPGASRRARTQDKPSS